MRNIFTLLIAGSLFIVNSVSAALSGTYTVGGTTPDYPDPAAAASAVVAQGVSGPVIFNIRPGTYFGKVNLTSIAGASVTNTITFQAENGDSTSVILSDGAGSSTTDNYLINIFGADWVTLRQLTLERTLGGNYGTVVRIDNISIGITVESCRVISIPTTQANTFSVGIFSPTGGSSVDSITTIRNNEIVNGSYGIHLAGPNSTFREARNVVDNNRILNCGNRGIQLQDQRNPIVRNNFIQSVGTSATQFYGIYATNIDRGVQVIGNRVEAAASGNCNGIQLLGVVGDPANNGLVANNFFSVTGASGSAGIQMNGTSYHNLLYNSINVYGNVTNSSGIAFVTSAGGNNRLINNNIVSVGTGLSVGSGLLTAIIESNFNNIYGITAVGNWNGNVAATLADWQAASTFDANSVSGDPQYISNTDLHAASAVVNDFGTPQSSITTDFDGDLRSLTTPDIGADEFTPLNDNVGPVAFVTPTQTTCGNSTVQVIVNIRNYGGVAQSNIPVTVEVTGAVTATLTDTYAGPLNPGTTATISFAQTLNTLAGGTIDMVAYTAQPGDQDISNDTITGSANFIALPNAPAVNSFNYCPGGVITQSTDSGFATFWYDSDTSSTPLSIGNTYSPNLTADATLWVESRQEGAGGCLRITEVALDDPLLPLGSSGDYIEIQNLSLLPFDATGWKVISGDGATNINTVNPATWDLGVLQAGEVQYRSDNANDNYWGANLLYNPNSACWVMIIDENGIVQDFVGFGWSDADIQNLNINVAGFNITVGSQWIGNGSTACSSGSSVSRTGNTDNDNANDWTCSSYTCGQINPGMSSNFSGCGYGACPSIRIPVQVTVLAPITVSLGPDTAFSSPFSYTLDAGAGFSSYLWSDGSTNQTLTVTADGQYSVLVTNTSGCSAADTVNITINTGVATINTNDIALYPNPASSSVTLSGILRTMGDFTARVTDLQGREVYARSVNGTSSDQLVIETSTWAEGTYMLQLLGDNFTCNRTLVVSHR